jgi:hypothetical protein
MCRATLIILLAGILFFVGASHTTNAQDSETIDPAATAQPIQQSVAQPSHSQVLTAAQQLQADVQKLHADVAAQRAAQDIIKWYAELGAAIVTILGVFVAVAGIGGLIFQGFAFRAEARIRVHHQDEQALARAQFQEENARQAARENALNERFVRLLDVASGVAEQAQRKVVALEEGGLNKAGVTLT